MVTITIDGVASKLMATPSGTVAFTVPLGVANSGQQYRPGSVTTVSSANVPMAQD